MKIYVAGPMTGYPGFNFKAFDEAKMVLEQQGHLVTTPADIDRSFGFHGTDKDVGAALMETMFRADILTIFKVDALYMLRGWEQSRGAFVEFTVAKFLGRKFLYQEPLDSDSPTSVNETLFWGESVV